MTIRAKFQVQSIKSFHGFPGKEVVLIPNYDKTIPEDQSFSEYTPAGELRMTVDNPVVLEQLQQGKYFYIDLTPIG